MDKYIVWADGEDGCRALRPVTSVPNFLNDLDFLFKFSVYIVNSLPLLFSDSCCMLVPSLLHPLPPAVIRCDTSYSCLIKIKSPGSNDGK